MVEVFNRDGIDASLELATPDVEVATAPGFPGGGRFQGRDAAGNFLREFVETWDRVRYEIGEPRLVHGCVVHAARWVVRGRASDVDVAIDVYGVARFEVGLLASLELFWTEEDAIERARGEAR